MLTQKLELCRTGIHGQSGVVVTEKDIKEIVENYTPKSAAVTIWPHDLAEFAPALGTVDAVWMDKSQSKPGETALYGSVTFNDLLKEAYEKKLYPTWSIGAPRRKEDGKRYLHHLKMCGAEPAAVKGLKDLTAETGINLSDCSKEDEFIFLSDNPSKGEKKSKEKNMDKILKAIEAIEDAEEKKAAKAAYDALLKKQEAASGDAEKVKALEAETSKLKGQLKTLSEKHPEEKIELSDIPRDPMLDHVLGQLKKTKKEALLKAAEGKIPKGMEHLVIALCDTFETQETIELSDGEEKEKASAFDVLEKLFKGLPSPTLENEILLSDPGDDPAKKSSSRDLFKTW